MGNKIRTTKLTGGLAPVGPSLDGKTNSYWEILAPDASLLKQVISFKKLPGEQAALKLNVDNYEDVRGLVKRTNRILMRQGRDEMTEISLGRGGLGED